ncbi:hypothetical protein C0033_04995 [Clostridium sp. chh4-2]|uniref:hypothetical protein n=1 Tax=Clostridium sp. chh4-2 TaxID=2067550 RepID=UPI000CCF8E71|nr:hypothetical protein [Clostridium sp. chh4-2]PNV62897.1 hypothetical protein C0033_04995 [Clostridium sp. chh4-2]
MKKRICPICDQVMHSAHYCSACRSWVKEPYIMEVNYYLNESHPKTEADCSYHNDAETVPARYAAPLTGNQPIKTKTSGSAYSSWKPVTPPVKPVTPPVKPVTPPVKPVTSPVKSVESRDLSDAGNGQKKPKSGMRWILWLVLFIYVIMPLFGSLISTVTGLLRRLF